MRITEGQVLRGRAKDRRKENARWAAGQPLAELQRIAVEYGPGSEVRKAAVHEIQARKGMVRR